jgi:hypothetical protein
MTPTRHVRALVALCLGGLIAMTQAHAVVGEGSIAVAMIHRFLRE